MKDHALRKQEEGRQAKAQVIAAVDCDLRGSFVVATNGKASSGDDPLEALTSCDIPNDATVIFEIAEPQSFLRGHQSSGAMYNLAKWTIWNVTQAVLCSLNYPNFFVAPASKWTKGYSRSQRQTIARACAKNKDLRDCEAMLWFYHKDPSVWVTLPQYLSLLRRASRMDEQSDPRP